MPPYEIQSKTIFRDDTAGVLRGIVVSPMIEEKMLILLRQNKISKWFSGIGQEAIAVGLTQALEPDEYILPMHRNLGVFTGRKCLSTDCSHNGKARCKDIQKEEIALFTLEQMNITLSE